MDFASLLTVRWDAPYRFLASFVGITAVFVPATETGAFKTLSEGAASLSWGWVAVPLAYVDGWIVEHLAGAGPVSLLFTAVAAAFAYTETTILAKSRATATVWLLAAVAAYTSPLWLVLVAVAAGLTARAVHSHFSRTHLAFRHCVALGVLHVVAGLAWAPLVMISWPIDTPQTKREEIRSALRGQSPLRVTVAEDASS